jgi:hypothetical protein
MSLGVGNARSEIDLTLDVLVCTICAELRYGDLGYNALCVSGAVLAATTRAQHGYESAQHNDVSSIHFFCLSIFSSEGQK